VPCGHPAAFGRAGLRPRWHSSRYRGFCFMREGSVGLAESLNCFLTAFAMEGTILPSLMVCKTCDDLLAAWKRSVRLFTDAERGCQGLHGDDFQLALKKLQRLHLACMDANCAMTTHWSQHTATLLSKLAACDSLWRRIQKT
jgi:hypothetical protein